MSLVKILVCCHKETAYLENDIFKPILLGTNNADKKLLGFFDKNFKDNQGINISDKHPYYAELTSIYWAWKNYEQLGNPEYIGLFHYRRFFNFKEKFNGNDPWQYAFFNFNKSSQKRFGWDENTIKEVCEGSDIVVTEAEKILHPRDWVSSASLEEHYKYAHYPEDFDILKGAIEKLYPNYKDVVKDVSGGNYGHFCNMFIMSRKTFFEYAEWLFNILFYVEDKLDFSTGKYEKEQKRVLGFLGERLLSYFVEYQRRNGAKIKEYQRLIGYLTIQDKQLFLKRFGVNAIKNIMFKQDCNDYTEKKISTELSQNEDSHVEKTEILLKENKDLHTKMPLVSIVVAMYKVEPYLRECINSLVNQTLEDIEVIFVDNGSPDNSADIVKEYMFIDSRIRLIRLSKNCLLPGARNAGQQVARGKYVAHVDGDDVCRQDMYEKLYLKAEELGADIVACSVNCFIDTIENCYLHRPLEWFRNSDVILPVTQRSEMFLEPAAWNKLFRRTYIESIGMQFTEGSSFGDEIPGMTKALIETDKIAVVQEALYFYRVKREGSITSKMRKEYIDSIIYALLEQKRILMEHNFSDVNTMTFIVEFKILVMCYVLNGLSSKDKKYFFENASRVFDIDEKKYLDRFFSAFPRKKYLYDLIVEKNYYTYRILKFLMNVYVNTKNITKKIAKKILKPSYSNFHRIYNVLGIFKLSFFDKKHLVDTINTEIYDLKRSLNDLNHKNDNLSQLLTEAIKNNEKIIIEANAQIKEKLEHISLIDKLIYENKELSEVSDKLTRENYDISSKNDTLTQSITELRKSCDYLGNIVESKKNYYNSVWYTGWIDYWKKYYIDNHENIYNLTERLKRNLDFESCKLIDLITERNFLILPEQKYTKLFLYDHMELYTEEEKAFAKKEIDFEIDKNLFKSPEDVIIEPSVFYYHCGLKLIPPSITKYIKNKDIIDGGAYWGDSAVVFNLYEPKSIHCFEPLEKNFNNLKETIELNNLKNVIPCFMGLGETSKNSVLYHYGLDSGANMFKTTLDMKENENEKKSDIKIINIDSYVEENKLNVGYIKLDIEGNEYAAIQGAKQTIEKYKPILSISIYHQPTDFFEIKPLIESWNLDYQFIIRKLVGHDLLTEVMLLGFPKSLS